MASFAAQYRQIESAHLTATYVYTVEGADGARRVALGQLDYWALGERFRVESTVDSTLAAVGLMGSLTIAFDGTESRLLFTDSGTLIKSQGEVPNSSSTPNPLFLPLVALGVPSARCGDCPLSLADARAMPVRFDESKTVHVLPVSRGINRLTVLDRDRHSSSVQARIQDGSWRVDSADVLGAQGETLTRTTFGDYRVVPGTEPSLALPRQVKMELAGLRTAFPDQPEQTTEERLLAIDIVVTRLDLNVALDEGLFSLPDAEAAVVIDEATHEILRAPTCSPTDSVTE